MFFSAFFGIAVFVGALLYASRDNARMWRVVAAHYGVITLPPSNARRFPEQALFRGYGVEFRHYVPLTVSIHETGLSLSANPLVGFFCPRIFLPFDEMMIQPMSWYLNAESHALSLARTVDAEIIIDDRLLSWIRTHSNRV